jgi:hypothetical protein
MAWKPPRAAEYHNGMDTPVPTELMMLEPVIMVRLDMMNNATMRLATSLAIFNDNILGFSYWLTPPGMARY